MLQYPQLAMVQYAWANTVYAVVHEEQALKVCNIV